MTSDRRYATSLGGGPQRVSDRGERIGEPLEKSLERQVRAFHWMRLLSELSLRRAGSEQEREAGSRVAGWLHNLGLDQTAFAAVPSRPQPAALLALHLGVAGLGCALGGLLGLALAALAAESFRRERAGRAPWLSRLLRAPDSQNVVARTGAPRPRRRVVLTADLDVAPPGRWLGLLTERCAERGLDPSACAAALLAMGVVVCAASALGAGGMLAATARALTAALLGLAALAGLEALRAPGSPAADADASGVAALLTCAEQLVAQLPSDVELWCAATGAGRVGGRGVRALVEAHPEWLSDRTAFVHFGTVSGGALGVLRSERGGAPCAYPPMLCELARRVAAGGAFGAITPADAATPTSARAIAQRGGQLLSLVALGADGRPARGTGVSAEPADAESVIRAADFAASVVSAHLRGDAEPLAYV